MGYGSALALNVDNMTDTATWRATGAAISAAMEDAGWVKQSVTGTVDWDTSTPGNVSEIWAPPDTEQATDPLYVHLAYSQSSGYLTVIARFGRYTSGLPASAATAPSPALAVYTFYGNYTYLGSPMDFHTATGDGWGWVYCYKTGASPVGDALGGYTRTPDSGKVHVVSGTTPNSNTGDASRNYLYNHFVFDATSQTENVYNVPFAVPGPARGSAGGDVDLFRQLLRASPGGDPFANPWAVALRRGEVTYGQSFTATAGGESADWLCVPTGPFGSEVTYFCVALRKG